MQTSKLAIFIVVLLLTSCTEAPNVATDEDPHDPSIASSEEVTAKGSPRKDSDGDGINDNDDPCPNDPTNTCEDGGGGSDTGSCAIEFDLTVESGYPVYSDGVGDGIYRDGSDYVLAFTGSGGDGWRFDTKSGGNPNRIVRELGVNLTGVTDSQGLVIADLLDTPNDGLRTIDMRFQPDVLNLCEVGVSLPSPSTVSVGMGFPVGNTELFPYGGVVRYGATNCTDGSDAAEMVVTRISESTWTFEGSEACAQSVGPAEPATGVFNLPFKFTLVAQ